MLPPCHFYGRPVGQTLPIIWCGVDVSEASFEIESLNCHVQFMTCSACVVLSAEQNQLCAVWCVDCCKLYATIGFVPSVRVLTSSNIYSFIIYVQKIKIFFLHCFLSNWHAITRANWLYEHPKTIFSRWDCNVNESITKITSLFVTKLSI